MEKTTNVRRTVSSSLQDLPESNPSQLNATRHRNALVMQVIKESADSEKNIAREMDWNKPSRFVVVCVCHYDLSAHHTNTAEYHYEEETTKRES
ncbi:uncharacterized protein LOC132836340 isoform X2 [Hemiscyllium ocellatum]|uniref:uncharacterized protein LOC132836340 isoform X2 n=1 Tax=Hemiscyllium ocellatum TaxID=170820 RepID=UPI0029660242|nr:uncharacterized protein LOC132836340 isoform X2 [Hemiscyllium ocellatum]